MSGTQRGVTVLHLCLSCPPEWSGGAAIFAFRLGAAQTADGMRVHYLCSSSDSELLPGEFLVEDRPEGHVTRVGAGLSKAGHAVRATTKRRLRALLHEQSVDIVHVHVITELLRPLYSVAREEGVPFIVTLHDGAWICANYFFEHSITRHLCQSYGLVRCLSCRSFELTRGSRAVEYPRRILSAAASVVRTQIRYRPLLERMDRIVSCCEYVGNQYRALGVRHPITAVNNLVPYDEPAFPRVRSVHSPLRIGVMGGFREHKGGDIILGAVQRLRDRFFEFVLDVWGPSPESHSDVARMVPLNAPVVFHGYYERDQLGAILGEMDVMIHASTWDSYSTVVLEALAARVPVIAVRETGTVEIVTDGINGFLFGRHDMDDLSAVVRRVLDNPERLADMRRAMRPPAPYRNMVDAYAALYSETVGLSTGQALHVCPSVGEAE